MKSIYQKKHWISVVACIVFLLLSVIDTSIAEDFYRQENGIYYKYKIENDAIVLLSMGVEEGYETPAEIDVPAEINGYPVRSIGAYAFDDCNVGYDGNYFNGEAVKQIVLPEGIETLEENALGFMYHAESVVLPASVKNIFPSFDMCKTHILVNENNVKYKVIDGFLIDTENDILLYTAPCAAMNELPKVKEFGSFSLVNYQKERLVFPETTQTINSYVCFDTPRIMTIEIPGSVKKIDDFAFYCMEVNEVILHEGIEKIGAYAFCNLSIDTLIVPKSVEWLGYEYADTCMDITVLNPTCCFETEDEYYDRTSYE